MTHPVKLYTGRRSVLTYPDAFALPGVKKALLVTGAHAARESGALEDVRAALGRTGIACTLFDGIAPNPTVEMCRDAGRLAHDFGADIVVGIGGGSALDAAKAAAVFALKPDLDEDRFYAFDWKDALPVFLVGTTAGTGSEVTQVSVLTDRKGRKHSIHAPLLYARAAFGDPAYIKTQSPATARAAGIDVLAHCAESWFSRKSTPDSRAHAARGIRLLYEPLTAAIRGEALTDDALSRLYESSLEGGLAIDITGTCFPHNVGYYLTERFRVPHGFACAAFFPELMAHSRKADPALADALLKSVSLTEEALLALAGSALPPFDFSLSREEIREALPRWENNGSVKNTIGTVTLSDIENMLNKFTA